MKTDKGLRQSSLSANIAAYGTEGASDYIDGAPHVKHASLRRLYSRLLVSIYKEAAVHASLPRVLDMGAGEGSATLPFLELGAQVTAVDVSSAQLQVLKRKCGQYRHRLETRCEEVGKTLQSDQKAYDIIVANSFLHHIPDYLGLIHDSIRLLNPYGQFFSFQDPLRYDTLSTFTWLFDQIGYLSWRIFKGDVWAGLKRRLRRGRGIYYADSMHDNAEYHVVRNGVDQDAIAALFEQNGFRCTVTRYFSTQNGFFQDLGNAMGIQNTFSIIARPNPDGGPE